MPLNRTSFIFLGIDKFSRVAEKIRKSTRRVAAAFKKAKDEAEGLRTKLKAVASAARSYANSMKYAAVGVSAFYLWSFKQSAIMETLRVGFDVLIGDIDKSKRLFEDLTEYAARTPFRLMNIAGATKVLLAAGVGENEALLRIRQLGDLASASDRPIREFALIFSKIKGKNKVQGEELLQLAEKSVGFSRILAKMYNDAGYKITELDVFKAAEQGLITYEHFLLVLDKITGEHGQFYGMTKRLALTLGGLWSTVADNAQLAFAAFGTAIVKAFGIKGILQWTIDLLDPLRTWIREFEKAHPIIFKAINLFIVFLALTVPLALGILAVAVAFKLLLPTLLVVKAAFLGVTGAITSTWVALFWIPVAIIAGITAIIIMIAYWDELTESIQDFGQALRDEFAWIDFILLKVEQLYRALKWIAGWTVMGGHDFSTAAGSGETKANLARRKGTMLRNFPAQVIPHRVYTGESLRGAKNPWGERYLRSMMNPSSMPSRFETVGPGHIPGSKIKIDLTLRGIDGSYLSIDRVVSEITGDDLDLGVQGL